MRTLSDELQAFMREGDVALDLSSVSALELSQFPSIFMDSCLSTVKSGPMSPTLQSGYLH